MSNFPSHLTMFWPDENTAEWFSVVANSILVEKFKNGTLKVPGHTRQVG